MAAWGLIGRRRRAETIPQGFGEEARALLSERATRAAELATERGVATLASVTCKLADDCDPLAHVAPARREGESWSVFSQPARDGLALATLGEAARVSADGASRFERVASASAELLEAGLHDDLFDDPQAPAGSGVTWVGGFGFLHEAAPGEIWRDFPAAGLVLPEISIAARGGDSPAVRLTVNLLLQPGVEHKSALDALVARVEGLRLDEPAAPAPAPPSDDPGRVTSVLPPEHYLGAVAGALDDLRSGRYEKIVLAREATVEHERAIDVVAVLRSLQEDFPDCTIFALSFGGATLLGATPELLVRREGRRASTMALAGSVRRGEDPEADAMLGSQLLTSAKNREEHQIVVHQIERTLGRYSAWVSSAREPVVVKVRNIQHLATPIRAQLTEPRPVLELVAALHPTPAVGGEPWPDVRERIRELEGFDRGWYTGGVGWTDQFEDGEFHVALRSALVEGSSARLWAGCGLVDESDAEAELAETETKLSALLPALSRF